MSNAASFGAIARSLGLKRTADYYGSSDSYVLESPGDLKSLISDDEFALDTSTFYFNTHITQKYFAIYSMKDILMHVP